MLPTIEFYLVTMTVLGLAFAAHAKFSIRSWPCILAVSNLVSKLSRSSVKWLLTHSKRILILKISSFCFNEWEHRIDYSWPITGMKKKSSDICTSSLCLVEPGAQTRSEADSLPQDCCQGKFYGTIGNLRCSWDRLQQYLPWVNQSACQGWP